MTREEKKERNKRIVAEAAAGVELPELSNKYGLCCEMVKSICRSKRVFVKLPRRNRTYDRDKQLVADATAGMELPELARKYDISPQHARNICRPYGVRVCQPGNGMGRRVMAILFDLLNTSLSNSEIAVSRRVSLQRVDQVKAMAKAAGFEVRSKKL